MNEQLLPRHIQQRRQYDARRYARHLSQPELNRRIRDILLNMLRLTPDAKIGPLPISSEAAVWMEKWVHVLEEMQLRHGPYPAGYSRDIFHSEPFPNFASELADKAAKKLSVLGLKQGEVFIKFGRRVHMEALCETGALRLQPASYFSQQHHNGAIRDDELSLKISLALSRDDIVKLVVNPESVPDKTPEQRFDATFGAPTDYWLYCLTTSVEPRLFVDFNADACVIIRDKRKFSERLQEMAAKHLPSADLHSGPAVYVDPLLPKTAKIFVPLSKHFGYSYQEEYRFSWLPTKPLVPLSHVDLQLGTLKEFADLIVL